MIHYLKEKCLIQKRAYSHYETGEIDMTYELLRKLADFHNVSIDYILERTDKRMLT